MSKQKKWRRGAASETAVFTGALAEITVDTTNKRLVVHDGVTPGGFQAARLDEVVALNSISTAMSAWLDNLPTDPGALGSGEWWNNNGIPTRTP